MLASSERQPQGPLTEATLFILLSLVPGPSHGYAMLQAVEGLSEGRVRLSTGTLYGALKRLLEQGWITRYAEPEQAEGGRVTHAYALSGLGQRVLQAELARLEALVAVGRRAVGERA